MPFVPHHANAPWRNPVVLGAVIAVLVAGLLHGQAGGAGRIEGTARDVEGSALPGTLIAVTNGALTERVVSGLDGRFVFPSVPQGRYTVTAELAGFRTQQQTGVHVTSGGTTTVDLTLRVGCLHIIDYVHGPGLDWVLPAADAIVHLRIVAVSATQRFDFGDDCLIGVQYDATPIHVLTGGVSGRDSSRGIRFVLEDMSASFKPGQEYVAFLERHSRWNVLHPVMGASSLLPVTDGRVEWTRTDVPVLTDGMPVDDFLAALKPLLPGARSN